MQLNLKLRDTKWTHQIHIPHQQCTQIMMMGHRNTPIMLYWEILNSRRRSKKFPLIMLNLDNQIIERLQLSTYISRHQLLKTFKMIQILTPWQSAKQLYDCSKCLSVFGPPHKKSGILISNVYTSQSLSCGFRMSFCLQTE